MPKIMSPAQYGMMAAAAAGKKTKAKSLSQESARKMLRETPKNKRKRYAKVLAKKRKEAAKPSRAMRLFGENY